MINKVDEFDDITPEELEQRAQAADVEIARRKDVDPLGHAAAWESMKLEQKFSGRSYAGWRQ